MTVSFVIPQWMLGEIQKAASLRVESACVILAGVAASPNGDLRVLGRQLRWVGEEAYLRREPDSLAISSDGYVRALAEAETLGACCLWVHTHPGKSATPLPSFADEIVDEQLRDLFRLRSGSPYYGALIFSPTTHAVAFSGHVQLENGPKRAFDRLWQVGDRWQLIPSFESAHPVASDIFDRNIRAFGSEIQSTLGDLKVGIVGCGGTGSSVAEQLVRLGVRKFVLVDPDELSASNVTRVYGSRPTFVGERKVDVAAKNLRAIADEVEITTVHATITVEAAARQLIGCDVLFGCTDDNAGRLILSRLSTFLLLPVIDSGILLSSDANGVLTGIDGRVTTLVPDHACLVCRGRIDLARAASEMLTPAERVRRENEGYAPALLESDPAVVAFTTLVGATAVSELLERLIGYGPEPRPSEVLLRCHEREISTNIAVPREKHYCHSMSQKRGIGVTEPFLEQAWAK